MNEERETGIGCMTALVLIIVITLLAMCSCGSRKTITETIVTHDTLVVTHSDTVAIERLVAHHDTLRIETERVVTLVRDTIGKVDTVRVETNTTHWQHVADTDASSTFVAKVDSILRAMDARHDKQTVKVKTPVSYWLYAVFLALCFIVCVWLLMNTKKQ